MTNSRVRILEAEYEDAVRKVSLIEDAVRRYSAGDTELMMRRYDEYSARLINAREDLSFVQRCLSEARSTAMAQYGRFAPSHNID